MNDRGTPERWKHGRLTIRAVELKAGHATEDVACDTHATVADALFDRGQINARQLDAAIWLDSLRIAAGLEPRQVSSYNPLGTGGEITDDQAEARAQFNKAVRALAGDAGAVLALLEGSYAPKDLSAVQQGLAALVRWRG